MYQLRVECLQEEVKPFEFEEVDISKQRRYRELKHEKNRWSLRIHGQGKKQKPSLSQ